MAHLGLSSHTCTWIYDTDHKLSSRTIVSATKRERGQRIMTRLYCFFYEQPCLFWTTNLTQRESHQSHRRRHIRRWVRAHPRWVQENEIGNRRQWESIR